VFIERKRSLVGLGEEENGVAMVRGTVLRMRGNVGESRRKRVEGKNGRRGSREGDVGTVDCCEM